MLTVVTYGYEIFIFFSFFCIFHIFYKEYTESLYYQKEITITLQIIQF